MARRFRFLLAFLACFALHASASPPLSSHPRTSHRARPPQRTIGSAVIPLYGPWKFRIGDSPLDPATRTPLWAASSYNDSAWETVDLTPRSGAIHPNAGFTGYVPGWTAKGHPGYWGYAWYRLRISLNVDPGTRLALAGPSDIDDAYQVYIDGALLGGFGRFSGHRPLAYSTQPVMFPLPEPASPSGATAQLIAFRVWMEPNTLASEPEAGGIHTAPLLGEAGVIAARYRLAWVELIRSYITTPALSALFVLLAIMAASLVLFDRSDPVYLWLAGVFLLTAISSSNAALAAWTQWETLGTTAVAQDVFLHPLTLGTWVGVWWVWFRLRRPAWMPGAVLGLTLLYVLSTALGEDLFFTVVPHGVSAAFHVASIGARLSLLLLLTLIIVRAIRLYGREAWLALPAVILVGIAQFENEIGLHFRTAWFPLGIGIGLGQIADVLLVGVFFALLLRRLLFAVRRQREVALDIKQAQQVQQVLLPEPLTSVPGLTVASEYRPAREVGGDFFQILPCEADGSLLIVAGDVTGKGLQAGMLVALLVGAIRTVAHFDPEPIAVLHTLNARLLGRGEAHATCLALRIASNGDASLANAGHIPPYLNGRSVEIEGALPLGMLREAGFTTARFHLAPGDTLTLISDGIAEARNKHGDLFGFERVEELLRRPVTPAALAAAAQAFGQDDDISVISICRAPA